MKKDGEKSSSLSVVQDDSKKVKCFKCSKEWRLNQQATYFYRSKSPLYCGNNGYLAVCKNCLNDLFYEYAKKLDDDCEAMRRICMKFDIYFDKSIFYSTQTNYSSNQKLVGTYLKNLNLPSLAKSEYGVVPDKTYDDTLDEEISNKINSIDDLANIPDNVKVSEKTIKTWGFGFDPLDYVYLENQFSDWKARVVIDGKARESLVRDLCIIKFHQQQAIKNKDIELYNKLQKTYQDTLSSANLKPIQEDANDKASEKPMGVMIDMFENERPIPSPAPEWQDVDGITKLVTIYFIGHLCKMLGLKNKYSKMYEDEMERYRVEIPELEETDDEDVFDFLINSTDDTKLSNKVGEVYE